MILNLDIFGPINAGIDCLFILSLLCCLIFDVCLAI